jgi:type VI secretion system secreted protein Hcp
MAVDMFLKLDGVSGESTDAKHKGEIEVLSWSFGASQSSTSDPRGGGGTGKVAMQDFHFVHVFSKATPTLMLACASGKHIPSGLLTVRKAGDKPVEYLKIKLSDCLVTSFQTGGSGGNAPTEQFSLNFASLQVNYLGTLADLTNQGGTP